jgi:spore germination cell wall hydrolase CwlJ-like protein
MLEIALVCLALNVYYEARGEPIAGQEAVAQVVLNRVKHKAFPNTVCKVVMQGGIRRHKCQFSWYCDGRSDIPQNEGAWYKALIISIKVMNHSTDLTNGATYYHALYVKPYWAKHLKQTRVIGSHIFYKKRPR